MIQSLFQDSEETMIPHMKPNVVFIGKKQKQKRIFFLKNKVQNGRLKKAHFLAPPILNLFQFHGFVL